MTKQKSIRGITPRAVKVIHEYARAVEIEDGVADPIPGIDAGGNTFEGTHEVMSLERNGSPPSLGFSPKNVVPPSLIEVFGDVEIVFMFSDDDRHVLADAILDFRNGEFVYILQS